MLPYMMGLFCPILPISRGEKGSLLIQSVPRNKESSLGNYQYNLWSPALTEPQAHTATLHTIYGLLCSQNPLVFLSL